MNNEKANMPTKEEVKKLLEFIVNDRANHLDTVGALLGMKMLESLLPDDGNEPNWGYEDLAEFFKAHDITSKDSLTAALKKIDS